MGARVAAGHDSYRLGDGLKAGYRAERDGYCLLAQKAPSGQVTALQPLPAPDGRVTAGSVYVFPPQEGSTVRVAGAPGTGQLAVICSASPMRFETLRQANPQSLSVAVVPYQVVTQ
jgi:hypothetical protein